MLPDPADVAGHPQLEELPRRTVLNFPGFVEEALLALQIDLGLPHGASVKVAEDAAQVLLGDRGAERAGRDSDHACQLARPHALAEWSRPMIDGIL
ncbi:hypothetical protein D3C81_1439660 [compost metagenome]